jgi:hypothetical protein
MRLSDASLSRGTDAHAALSHGRGGPRNPH